MNVWGYGIRYEVIQGVQFYVIVRLRCLPDNSNQSQFFTIGLIYRCDTAVALRCKYRALMGVFLTLAVATESPTTNSLYSLFSVLRSLSRSVTRATARIMEWREASKLSAGCYLEYLVHYKLYKIHSIAGIRSGLTTRYKTQE